MLARYMLWPCPSVCPSIHLLQIGVLSKTANSGITQTTPDNSLRTLKISDVKDLDELQMWLPPTTALRCRWGRLKSLIFNQYPALRNDAQYVYDYYGS